jgi:chorismate dehydratase
MIFGKIDYINLLPFHIFLKRFARSTRFHATIHHKRDVPATINQAFIKRQIDGAIISSIVSPKYRCSDLGIVAKKEVMSVFVKPGTFQADTESQTSNALARVLGVEGEIIIGDKALHRYISGDEELIDLAQLWYEKHGLPFVFARLCCHKHAKQFQKLTQQFLQKPTKIPYYILQKEAKRTGLPPHIIHLYLQKIHYQIDTKAKKSLKKFLILEKRG